MWNLKKMSRKIVGICASVIKFLYMPLSLVCVSYVLPGMWDRHFKAE